MRKLLVPVAVAGLLFSSAAPAQASHGNHNQTSKFGEEGCTASTPGYDLGNFVYIGYCTFTAKGDSLGGGYAAQGTGWSIVLERKGLAALRPGGAEGVEHYDSGTDGILDSTRITYSATNGASASCDTAWVADDSVVVTTTATGDAASATNAGSLAANLANQPVDGDHLACFEA